MWNDNYWHVNYWQTDYWAEDATAPPVPSAGDSETLVEGLLFTLLGKLLQPLV